MKKKQIVAVSILFVGVIIFLMLTLSKDKKTNFVTQSSNKTIESLIKKEKGIYVFGFDSCPWCKELYPILDDVLIDRHEKSWVVDTHHKDFSKDNKDNLRRFIIENTSFDGVVVPLVIFISDDGFFQYHVGTLDDHDATKDSLTVNQTKYLEEMLNEMVSIYKEHNK